MRSLFIAAMIALPSTVSAQYLQDITTSKYSLRTVLTKQSDTRYLYQVQFRNESAFHPNTQFVIADVTVTGVTGNLPFGGRQETNLGTGFLGTVYTGTLSTGIPGTEPITFAPHWFDISSPGWISQRFGGSYTSQDVLYGWGLLGCSIPVLYLGWSGPNYAGSTCSHAGYNGWATLNLQLDFDAPTPHYAGDDISASVLGFEIQRPAVNIVPEPGTWGLVAAGLLGIGLVRRRRNKRSSIHGKEETLRSVLS